MTKPPRKEPAKAGGERVSPPVHTRPWLPRFATAAALLALGTWIGWLAPKKFPELSSVFRHEANGARLEDGGEAGLGDDSASAAMAASPTPSLPGVQGQNTLPEPLPDQARPDAKGRCPHPWQVPLNGGCWVKLKVPREEREKCCVARGNVTLSMMTIRLPPSSGDELREARRTRDLRP
ncbi:hypothetical protein [Hyalangium sp.]|uniref:hypothetical protein n=1 Tax=Hyalangium sp. TaxID=2028555 RepID=UPI002D56015C|nr:hypothetical protein [Hyalangium sp.]HYH95360.1 hypothetical protein [Hyalangium sp.]